MWKYKKTIGVVIGIVAVLIGRAAWKHWTSVHRASPPVAVKVADTVTTPAVYVMLRELQGVPHIFFRGEDRGVSDGTPPVLFGSSIVFTRTIDGRSHLIQDGSDIGEGMWPFFSEGVLSYLKQQPDGSEHLINDSKDYGSVFSQQSEAFAVAGKNVLLYRALGDDLHVFYNDTDLGSCGPVSAYTDTENQSAHSLAFAVNDQGYAYVTLRGEVVYNGSVIYTVPDMEQDEITDVYLDGNMVSFVVARAEESDDDTGHTATLYRGTRKFIIHTQNGFAQFYQDDGDYAFVNENMHIMYNAQDLGPIRTLDDDGNGNPVLKGHHIVFTRMIDGVEHVVYDGSDMGEGKDPDIADGHLAYVRLIQGVEHVLYDNKDMGEGTNPSVKSGSVVFYREIDKVKHVFVQGYDEGTGTLYW